MLALLAAQEAADIASGHGSPLTAPIGTGTVDGFAAGMLLSGVVFLLILAQRRALRRPAGAGAATTATRATAVTAGPAAATAHAGQVPAHDPARDQAQAQDQAQESALGFYPAPVLEPSVLTPSVLAAPVEADRPDPLAAPLMTSSFAIPGTDEQVSPALSTHPYADVRSFAVAAAPESFTPFADAANEVVLQPGVRLEEWLEGELRRPSLRRRTPAPPAPLPPVPAAVAAAEAVTAVVPAIPPAPAISSENAADSDLADEPSHQRRASAYQSKHRLVGRSDNKPWADNKPWPDNHRRVARHAAASPARTGPMSRMFGLRQLRPVSAGD